jgi:hypothetical protein
LDRFLVASLTLAQASEPADWLADETSAHYEAIDPTDLDDASVLRVFELYQATYRALGEPFLKDPYALFKYDRWVLFYASDDHSPKSLVACALFDVTSCGLKGRFKASDLSPQGRSAVKAFAVASYNAQGVFGEVSDKLEAAILDKVRVVPFEDARRVLKKLGHVVEDAGQEHYARSIHGEQVTKVMVGYPHVPDDEGLP